MLLLRGLVLCGGDCRRFVLLGLARGLGLGGGLLLCVLGLALRLGLEGTVVRLSVDREPYAEEGASPVWCQLCW